MEMNPQSPTYRRPYQGFNSWNASPTAASPSGSSLIQTGGGASGGGNQGILNTLLGFTQNTPATPQYDLPQTPQLPQYELPSFGSIQQPTMPNYAGAQAPASIQPMQLPQMGEVQRPDALQMPQLQSPGQLSMPTLNSPDLQWVTSLQTPGALGAGPGLQMPQLSIPGDLQMPGQLTNPTLAPGASLESMASATLPYQAMDTGIFGTGGQATPIVYNPSPMMGGGYGGGPWGGQNGGPDQTLINSGISPLSAPGAPQAGPMPTIEGMGQTATGTMPGAAGAALQPQMMQQQADYLGNRANYNLAGQQAQSQSGLNWANLSQLLQQAYQNAGTQGQGNTLGFLGGMAGGL